MPTIVCVVLALVCTITMHLTVNTCYWSCFYSVFCCFFCRYEWSKFVLILSPRAFCKLQRGVGGGCMGTIETRGDSSHILEEKCFRTTCSSSQTIRLQSVVFPRQCVAHTLAACHVKRTVIQWNGELWEFKSCKFILHKTRQRCNCLTVRTGLQKFLTPFGKQTQTTITLVLSYVNYCLMGSSICSSPVSCFGNISFPTNSSTPSLASALIIGCMAKLARFFLCNIMCRRDWAVTRLWSPSHPLLIMNSNLFQ